MSRRTASGVLLGLAALDRWEEEGGPLGEADLDAAAAALGIPPQARTRAS